VGGFSVRIALIGRDSRVQYQRCWVDVYHSDWWLFGYRQDTSFGTRQLDAMVDQYGAESDLVPKAYMEERRRVVSRLLLSLKGYVRPKPVGC
jgi:hypothetical protein